MSTGILSDPRVTARPARASNSPAETEYLIDGQPPADVNPSHRGYLVSAVNGGAWNGAEDGGWVVFNSFCTWIGSDRPPADREHEIDAKDVYPSAEAAVAAVLAALNGR